MLNGCNSEIKKDDFFESLLGQSTHKKALNGLSQEQLCNISNVITMKRAQEKGNSALNLPLNRTEPGKQTFVFQGAKTFVQDERSLVLFKHKLKYVAKTL